MKQFPNGIETMRTMHKYIADAYQTLPDKQEGVIQFNLFDGHEKINCCFAANGQSLEFVDGVLDRWDVKLEASLKDWIALAENKLNPILGVILRKLKFKGDIGTFSRIIPKNLYDVDISTFSDPVTGFEQNHKKNWIKPTKVLIIDSSPRGTNGYTKLYTDFIEQAFKENGVAVDHLMLSKYKILHCLGCLHCWLKSEGECILKDDVQALYERYEKNDLIVYSFPLYAYGVPGILKNFIDRGVMRQYPYFEKGLNEIRHPRRDKSGKAFISFSICGFPSQCQYDSVRAFFKLYSHSSHTPMVGEIYRPGGIFLLQNPFNYFKLKTFLDGLRESIGEIVNKGEISKRTMRKLSVGISEKLFLSSTNKYWNNLHKNKDMAY